MKKLMIFLFLLSILFVGCSINPSESGQLSEPAIITSDLGEIVEMEPQIGLVKFETKDLQFLSEKTELNFIKITDNYFIVDWTTKNKEDLYPTTKGIVKCTRPLQLVHTGCVTRYQCGWITIPNSAPSWHCYSWTYCSGYSCQ